eukprot:CAMPEP_0174724940 /NCGR_PEP_ID=MMETSP1094-20130205/44457_1 /TAXON_ID=156173 /ORGANISM="Chrysochromulina brevifilum, Strain UTEX LB 985" /LENGTH=85 /DNA_ID=CAMNT_0015926235 /DNA_START=126 /DNA_END=383 /DNA_ORIENTATION=-
MADPMIESIDPGWIIANDITLLFVTIAPVLTLAWYWATLACCPTSEKVAPADNGADPIVDRRQQDQAEENQLRANALELAKGTEA